MLIISYDIKDDKLRTKFSKYLSKYGYRLQYSVFHIKNSDRVIDLIKCEISDKFEKQFCESDSILIYPVDDNKVIRYGYAEHENDEMILL